MRVDDVLSDLDLLAVDRQALTIFGADALASIADKRRIAVDDWLAGELKAKGYNPFTHSLRRAPDLVIRASDPDDTDLTDRLADRSTNSPVALGAEVFQSDTDALVIGLRDPFKALTVVMTEPANVNTRSLSVASLTYWNGAWTTLDANSLIDTTRVNSISFAKGGVFRFTSPEDWEPRPYDSSDPRGDWLYLTTIWLTQPATLGALVSQILPTRRSRLTSAAGFYAMHLLCLEAAKGARGNWDERADQYAKKAYTSLARDLPLADDEFDVDNSGSVQPIEARSVVPAPSKLDPFSWERG